MALPGLDELPGGGVRGLRVFLRADLNAPLAGGAVADDARLRAALPTLRRLLEGGARVVLASHLGRPGGAPQPEWSLAPVRARLAELLGGPLAFCNACAGPEAEKAADALAPGEALLLENTRFHPGETRNDPALARAFARLADAFVNDAFGTAHRAHASNVGVARLLPRRAAGDLLRAELRALDAVRNPQRPLLCLLGGAKVAGKLATLLALAPHSDVLCIGGAMAYTFLRAQGRPTGGSRVEEERVEDARRVLAAAQQAGRRLLLPGDHICAPRMEAAAPRRVVEEISGGEMGLDIGPATAARYAEEVRQARTIFWNGPMGAFEIPGFAAGTEAVAQAVAAAPAHSIVGGGDSLAAVNALGLAGQIGHLSTGGGAALAWLGGLPLPGVEALAESAGAA